MCDTMHWLMASNMIRSNTNDFIHTRVNCWCTDLFNTRFKRRGCIDSLPADAWELDSLPPKQGKDALFIYYYYLLMPMASYILYYSECRKSIEKLYNDTKYCFCDFFPVPNKDVKQGSWVLHMNYMYVIKIKRITTNKWTIFQICKTG